MELGPLQEQRFWPPVPILHILAGDMQKQRFSCRRNPWLFLGWDLIPRTSKAGGDMEKFLMSNLEKMTCQALVQSTLREAKQKMGVGDDSAETPDCWQNCLTMIFFWQWYVESGEEVS